MRTPDIPASSLLSALPTSVRCRLPALEAAAVLLLTGLALIARLIWLDEIPPGLFYDEAYKGLDALAMLRDRTLPVFFPGNFGREPLFIWIEAGTQALFGAEPIVLRSTIALLAALSVPALYLAARELVGRLPALFAAAVFPFTLWHLVVSRVALRFAMLPLVECLAVWLLARGMRTGRRFDFALAGLLFAACLYTYTAARMLPLLLIVAAIGAVALRPALMRQRWRAALLLPLTAAFALLPLGHYFLQNPLAFSGRVSQVVATDQPVVDPSFGPGDPGTLRDNPVRTLLMFWAAGDQNLRTNLPGRPVFDPLMGSVFALGILAALVSRQPAGLFTLAWLGIMLLPSALSTYAPHYARAIGALPPAATLAGLGLATVVRAGERFGRTGALAGITIAVAITAFSARLTLHDYFDRWANELGTYQAFDTGIWELGRAMRDLPATTTLYVSPLPGDHPTLVYASRRDDIRGYDGRAGIVLSPGGAAAYGVIVGADRTTEPTLGDAYGARPAFIALDPGAQPWAVLTLVDGPPRLAPSRLLDAQFAEAGRLFGVMLPERLEGRESEVTLFWQADGPTTRPLTVFVQLLDEGTRLVAQHDSQPLAASFPTTRWKKGEIIVERRRLRLPADLPRGQYRLIAGLYDLATGERVPVSGSDSLGDAALLGLLER
ncbi:MAG: glycosyltransferase family 39 protein [Chloroflexota bacterium]|nr:glycosyltransferase family 39 protein [Dehalococcoidia bacterium]MDW8255306.1 glycosyltransferase family 39 protein [Chloroflexota bacterium]